jgi:hypothetical protein
MKAVDFDGTITPDGQIAVPAEIAGQFPPGESLHIVLRRGTTDEEDEWRAQGRQRFEAAYATEDFLYERLMDEVPTG